MRRSAVLAAVVVAACSKNYDESEGYEASEMELQALVDVTYNDPPPSGNDWPLVEVQVLALLRTDDRDKSLTVTGSDVLEFDDGQTVLSTADGSLKEGVDGQSGLFVYFGAVDYLTPPVASTEWTLRYLRDGATLGEVGIPIPDALEVDLAPIEVPADGTLVLDFESPADSDVPLQVEIGGSIECFGSPAPVYEVDPTTTSLQVPMGELPWLPAPAAECFLVDRWTRQATSAMDGLGGESEITAWTWYSPLRPIDITPADEE